MDRPPPPSAQTISLTASMDPGMRRDDEQEAAPSPYIVIPAKAVIHTPWRCALSQPGAPPLQ
jgi:hypothetical protein